MHDSFKAIQFTHSTVPVWDDRGHVNYTIVLIVIHNKDLFSVCHDGHRCRGEELKEIIMLKLMKGRSVS